MTVLDSSPNMYNFFFTLTTLVAQIEKQVRKDPGKVDSRPDRQCHMTTMPITESNIQGKVGLTMTSVLAQRWAVWSILTKNIYL